MLFGGGDWFKKGGGGGRNGCGVAKSMVLADLGVLLEVVILVQLIV